MKEGDKITEGPWAGFTVISIYTRQQAIAGGVLIDLTANYPEDTRIFKWNLCCTAAVWAKVQEAANGSQSEAAAYVYDLCFMAIHRNVEEIAPNIHLFQIGLPLGAAEPTTLKMVAGPVGPDDPTPCLTIMLPDED